MILAQMPKSDIELSCREAHLILRLIPLRKIISEMTEEEIAAVRHYNYCKDCRERGLTEILNEKLSCQESILVWAENAGALWLNISAAINPLIETLIELYATEHVWGKWQWENSMGGRGWDIGTGCQEWPCRDLSSYWAGVPMSSSAGDGPKGVIHLFPFLFELFLRQNWPLDDLLAVQKERIAVVIEDIEFGEVTVSGGHYHFVNELVAEMSEHISSLQKLAVRSQAQIVSV